MPLVVAAMAILKINIRRLTAEEKVKLAETGRC
mgnify:CR=1 FL=1